MQQFRQPAMVGVAHLVGVGVYIAASLVRVWRVAVKQGVGAIVFSNHFQRVKVFDLHAE